VSSRYLTFALAIACLAIPVAARLGEELSGSAGRAARRLLLAAAPLWLLFSAVAVRSAIPVWAHDGTLNTWAIRQGATQYWRYQNLGDYYLRIHAPREAREAIATAVKLRGDVALNWYYLGLAEAGLGNVTEARAAFQRALELDAGDVRSRVNLARLELAAGAPDRAAALLEGGLQYTRQPRAQPLEGLVHFLLGRSYGALGRTDDARAAFEHARQRAQTQGERAAAESELRTLPAPRP
jgi:tetratricopeptide (TPR) repeat protein